MDREPEQAPSAHLRRELVLAARQYARASDALLVSDYGYGAATPALLKLVRDRGRLERVPVVLDSRHRMLEYSGITAATPNEPEVEECLRLRIGNDWSRLCVAGEKVIEQMGLQSLLITRGRDGIEVLNKGQGMPRAEPLPPAIWSSHECLCWRQELPDYV